MPRLHSLELLLDGPGTHVVRRDWGRLRQADLPSQLDHGGSTNAPHLTVLAAPAVPDDVRAAAVDGLGALLPLRTRAGGLVVLGGRRVVLARLLDVADDAAVAVARLRAATPDVAHDGWLPHVTLARGLPRTDVQRAIEALGPDAHADLTLTFTSLRHWDPDLERTTTLLERSVADRPEPVAGEPARVAGLHVAPGRRLPVRDVEEIEVEAGAGIVGDRYHGTRHRHVSVQSRTALDDAAADLGRPVPGAGTRRNITLNHGAVPTAPGARLRVGEVLLEVVRVAAPCRLLDDGLGPGAAKMLRRRGGSIFRVLEGGRVRVGDVSRSDDTTQGAT